MCISLRENTGNAAHHPAVSQLYGTSISHCSYGDNELQDTRRFVAETNLSQFKRTLSVKKKPELSLGKRSLTEPPKQ